MTLDQIALRYPTDKSSKGHNYTFIYEKYFESIRQNPVILLELGVGGYHKDSTGGGSLMMWGDYFSRGSINAIDIYDKSFLNKGRIKTFICSQDNEIGLKELINKIGNPQIIIDDASHINPLTIASFKILFPLLQHGGIYVVEDIHTSYWEAIAVDGTDFKGGVHPDTTINFFKSLADTLHEEHSGKKDMYGIASIQFWDKMVFILKK